MPPFAPAPGQAFRLVDLQAGAEAMCAFLEEGAAAARKGDHRLAHVVVARRSGVGAQSLLEHVAIMVVAQQLGECMGFPGALGEALGPDVAQQARMVPMVFHALAPFVVALAVGVLFRLAPRLAGTRIGLGETGGERVPAGFRKRPVRCPLARCLQQCACLGEAGVEIEFGEVGLAPVGKRIADRRQRIGIERALVILEDRIVGIAEHLGVARRAQQAGDLA